MSDDYLWDGSGEPDPEVERLENLLSRYRHKPAPLKMPDDRSRFAWSRLYSPQTAAAAALALIMIIAGLSYFLSRQDGRPGDARVATASKDGDKAGTEGDAVKRESPRLPEPGSDSQGQPAMTAKRRKPGGEAIARPHVEKVRRDSLNAVKERTREDVSAPYIAEVFDGRGKERVMTGSVDLLEAEAARHFEKAQVLLRSFRNVSAGKGESTLDVSYEKGMSRNLLSKNIVLRRGVEARRIYPLEDLLSSLEPILIDIANLPEKPSVDEVNSIKQRMQRKEIVATLQVYSAQASLDRL
ncbi:MAG TPA: hypothetical protein VNH22_07630 [Blastocatellia bacterium]|jgi:hypothetical protein|nr:hypothetical protein [Blastocatellia bacterium]